MFGVGVNISAKKVKSRKNGPDDLPHDTGADGHAFPPGAARKAVDVASAALLVVVYVSAIVSKEAENRVVGRKHHDHCEQENFS